MSKETAIKLFEQKQIRSVWDETDTKQFSRLIQSVQSPKARIFDYMKNQSLQN